MTNHTTANHVRRAALDRIDRSARFFKYILVATAIWEGVLLVSFLLLMDFSDRLHLLLLIATLLTYGTLGLGLVALGAYLNRGVARITKAIELIEDAGKAN